LIEGDGHINTKCINIYICFHNLDASLAYFIKKQIGFGVVSKIKDKNVIIYRGNLKGSIAIAKLINGKLRTDKINNFNCLLQLINEQISSPIIPQERDTSSLKNSYWLSGFSDASASFQIKTGNSKFGYEIQLNYQLDQQKFLILEQIKEVFGGSIEYIQSQDTYYYASVNLGSAKKFMDYFDHFNLLSSKHINYLKWRNVYRLIQSNKHLSQDGMKKILKIKSNMNSLSKDYIKIG
jgi:LAGLIDADG DNA endonuclease family protein